MDCHQRDFYNRSRSSLGAERINYEVEAHIYTLHFQLVTNKVHLLTLVFAQIFTRENSWS